MPTEETKGPNILLVDDSEIDTMVLSHTLKRLNIAHKPLIFNFPQRALEYLKEIDQKEDIDSIPDLILLDLNMPGMNGFEFLDKFGKLSEKVTSKTRFFVISSSDSLKDISKVLQFSYVLKYFQKPIQEAELAREYMVNFHTSGKD